MKTFIWIAVAAIVVCTVVWLAVWGVDWIHNQIDRRYFSAGSTPIQDSTLVEPDSLNKIVSNQIKIYKYIDDHVRVEVIAGLLKMQKDSTIKEIEIFIDSKGGDSGPCLNICYVMKLSKKPVKTVVRGVALSGAAFISSSGTKGRRFAVKNAQIMIHRPALQGFINRALAEDFERWARELRLEEQIFYDLLNENTGRSVEEFAKDLQRDFYLNTKQAIDYGLIDSLYQEQ